MQVINTQLPINELNALCRKNFVTIVTEAWGGIKSSHQINNCTPALVVAAIPSDQLFHHYEVEPRPFAY